MCHFRSLRCSPASFDAAIAIADCRPQWRLLLAGSRCGMIGNLRLLLAPSRMATIGQQTKPLSVTGKLSFDNSATATTIGAPSRMTALLASSNDSRGRVPCGSILSNDSRARGQTSRKWQLASRVWRTPLPPWSLRSGAYSFANKKLKSTCGKLQPSRPPPQPPLRD